MLEVDLWDDERALGSDRQALELSMTMAPAAAAMGAYSRETPAPALNSANLTPASLLGSSASTTTSLPQNFTVVPALRGLARGTSAHGEPTLFEYAEHLPPYGARRADHGHRHRHASLLPIRLIPRDNVIAGDGCGQMCRSSSAPLPGVRVAERERGSC